MFYGSGDVLLFARLKSNTQRQFIRGCTHLSYDSVEEIAKEKHLARLSDSVLDEYTEEAE
jgi:hypothetical protein